mgnify:CR=1 FL=1
MGLFMGQNVAPPVFEDMHLSHAFEAGDVRRTREIIRRYLKDHGRFGWKRPGSINQLGKVQPIGGVNEKIEGFFDVCRRRGLNGRQGVIIPARNVEHLMLRHDLVEAAGAGKFAVYPVDSVDEAVALLTDMEAGTVDEKGEFPANSVNGRVQARLRELASLQRAFSAAPRCSSVSNE